MRNILLKISYDGSNYHGWQVQKNAVTVQGIFTKVIQKIFKESLDIHGCSRTDSGVHANVYFCNFKTDSTMDTNEIIRAFNSALPMDISVNACIEVDEDFHARYSAKSKEYIYKVYDGETRNPFLKNYVLYNGKRIDTEFLNAQSKAFIGSHDFKGFCATGSKIDNTIRTVHDFSVLREDDIVIFKTSADGFLYNMVRIMVGTLLYVDYGNIEKDTLSNIIISGQRKNAGKTVKANGLYLNNVFYKENI